VVLEKRTRRLLYALVFGMTLILLTIFAVLFSRTNMQAQAPDAITVCGSGCSYSDLQEALNAATPGSRIVLSAGKTYTGNFVLPYKGEGGDPILVESSALSDLPPQGFRVQPEHARFMPKLVPADRLMPVLRAGPEEQYVERVDPATDTVFYSGKHGYTEGEPIAFWSDLVLPPGLEAGRTYYVHLVSPTALQLLPSASASRDEVVKIRGVFAGGRFRSNSILAGHNYILRGLEFTVAPNAIQSYHLVEIGTTYAMTRQGISTGMELDRVYIHGLPDQNGPRMCLLLNARRFVLSDSRLEHCNMEGEEGKGLGIVVAPGPGVIRNNYIEGGSINLLMGGDFVRVEGLISGDEGGIEIVGNHFYKPLWLKYTAGNAGSTDPSGTCNSAFLNTQSGHLFVCDSSSRWVKAPACARGEYFRRADVAQNCEAGACWECGEEGTFQRSNRYRGAGFSVKNLFEIKSGINIHIHGNVFENNWSNSDQSGVGVWIVSQVAQGNANGWVRGENITFVNNILRNSAQGIRVASEGNTKFGYPNRKVRVQNNLAYDIGATSSPTIFTNDARPISFAGPCVDCSFSNNTVVSGVTGGTGLSFDTNPLVNFRLSNNIFYANRYGILGDRGLPLSYYMPGQSVLNHNIMLAENPESARFASGNNKIVATSVPLFADTTTKNFRLLPESPYSAACQTRCEYTSDNQQDLGANIDLVEQETSGAVSGTPSWNDLFDLKVENVEPRSANLVYYVRSEDVCTLRISTNPSLRDPITDVDPLAGDKRQFDNREGTLIVGAKRTFRLGSVEPLQPNTLYYYKMTCPAGHQSGSFKTKPAE
jgi:hypothetical protein